MINKSKIALVALAALCLLAAPAFSMPSDKGAFGFRHDGKSPLINNLTAEEMGNMTLGELKEMQRQAWNNSAFCPAADAGKNCRRMDGSSGKKDNDGRRGKAASGMAGNSRIMLLMDDLTVEKLNNMTLNQIKELKDSKMQVLNNMTLNQIKELKDKKMLERNNMTLNELREEHKKMRQMAGILQGGRSFPCPGRA